MVPARRGYRDPLVSGPKGWATSDGFTLTIRRGARSGRLMGNLTTPTFERHVLAGKPSDDVQRIVEWADEEIRAIRVGSADPAP